jgi:hypothetical protein
MSVTHSKCYSLYLTVIWLWSKQRHIFICCLCQKSVPHKHNIWFVTSCIEHAMISHWLWHRMLSMQWYRTDCGIVCRVCNDITLLVTSYVEYAMISHCLWHHSQFFLAFYQCLFHMLLSNKLNWYCQLYNCHIRVKILSVNSCIKCNYFSINVYKKSYKRWTVSWCNFAWHSVTGNIRVV